MVKYKHILLFLVLTLFGTAYSYTVKAQNISSLPATGDWNGGTLTKSLDITLTGDVDLKGPIVIPSGKKLTIRKTVGANSSDKTLTYVRLYLSTGFTVPAGKIPCMFEVQEGGTLEIIGNNVDADDFIAIKGSTGLEPPTPMTDGVFNQSEVNAFYKNGTYKNNDGRYYPDPSKTACYYDFGIKNGANDSGAILYVVGTLVMKHAKIASGFSTVQGAAIKRPTVSLSQYNNAIFGTMTLDHVHIRNCYSDSGSAIIIFNQAQDNFGGGNTPTGCSTTLSDCKIYRNYSRCTEGVGGTIRTGGGVVGNLTMTNTTVYENYAGTYGGGMVTAAQGHENTVFVMDGCKIHDNSAATYAGAALISGSFQFKNNVTKIYNNKAGTYGGGLYLITYNGVKFTTPKTLNMNFSDKLELYGNTAGTSAGAICLNMRELTSLVEGSEININFEGVNIHDNTAAQDGGAVMMTYDNSKVDVNLNIKSCTINNNNATAGNGGGIYCQVGPISGDDPSPNVDVTKCKVNLNGGTISNNHADAACGGGVYVKNLPIYCDQNASGIKVHGNTSLNKGGGLYITGSEFTMYSGQIYGNSCTSATSEGGGIYADGAELNITGGVIGGNSAAYANRSHNGAGIFLYNSDLVMNQGQVSYNESNNNAGGIYVKDASNFTFNNGSISNNTCEVHGGGLYVSGCLSFNITNGVISGNTTKNTKGADSSNGGAMFLATNAKNVNISGGEISNNTSSVRGGAIASATGFTISAGRIIGNTSTHGGGIYFSHNANASNNSVVLSGGEVSDNTATGVGGAMYIYAGNLTIDGAEIKNNTSGSNGGGIDFDSSGQFTITSGKILDNKSALHGGGICALQGNLTIDGGEVSGNSITTSSGSGGGIYFSGQNLSILNGDILNNTSLANGGALCASEVADDGHTTVVEMSGGNITGNKAELNGGGLYISCGSFTFSEGVVSGNTAKTLHGGGIYLTTIADRVTLSGGEIRNNSAPKGYGGGVYINGATIVDVTNGFIGSNSAFEGGGLYANGGIVTISGGQINSNSGNVGGGIRLNSSANITITGGNVTNNTSSSAGGGFYTGGTSVCTFSNGVVSENTSGRGGGVFMMHQSQMTFSNGVIRNNRAIADGSDYRTAYENSNVRGAGGGIFITDYAKFTFDPNSSVGIYNNTADMVGDDLVKGSSNSVVVLPDVSKMVLTGYNSRTSELYWVEDYMTGDTQYNSGSMVAGQGHSPIRYRDAIAAQSTVYKVPAGTYTTKYLALSIGHEIIYITLRRNGLQPGESAIYRVFRIDNGTPTVYSELLLTGMGSGPIEKQLALYSGIWRIQEIPWTWSYETVPYIQRAITGSSTAQDKTFVFDSAKRADVPLHSEDIIINDFGTGTSQ